MRALSSLVVVSAIALAGCAKPETLQVIDPVVRLSANAKAPSAGYFTVKGGPVADKLISVTSPLVIEIQMHDSVMEGGMMKMKPLDAGVEVPAGGELKFAEGGKHLMLYNINPGVAAGERMQLNFTFASGTILQGYALVNAAGK